jgi:hypothetical protein
LILREADPEALIVEVHYVKQRRRRAVVKIRRPRSQPSALTATVICSLSSTSITGSPSIFITETH